MDNKDLENNVEFQKASKPEYYDNYLKEYVGYDYTKIKNKKDAREYRKNIKEQYRKGIVDTNNSVETQLNPYLKQMNDLMKDMPKDMKK